MSSSTTIQQSLEDSIQAFSLEYGAAMSKRDGIDRLMKRQRTINQSKIKGENSQLALPPDFIFINTVWKGLLTTTKDPETMDLKVATKLMQLLTFVDAVYKSALHLVLNIDSIEAKRVVTEFTEIVYDKFEIVSIVPSFFFNEETNEVIVDWKSGKYHATLDIDIASNKAYFHIANLSVRTSEHGDISVNNQAELDFFFKQLATIIGS